MSLFGKKTTAADAESADWTAPSSAVSGTNGATPTPVATTSTSPNHSNPALTQEGEPVATIGKSIHLKGELTGEEDLEVEGTVEGDVKLPNHVLKIGAHGKVMASVLAQCVQVIGRVSGDVSATERVEVESSGIVEGDIRAPRLLVQEGAVINGRIEMTAPAASQSAPERTPGRAEQDSASPVN